MVLRRVRGLVGIVVLALLVVSVFGCGSSGSKSNSPETGSAPKATEPAAPKDVEITVWGWPAADAAYASAMDGFKAKYPNIKVKFVMAGNSRESTDNLLTALAAGAGAPDVAQIEINQIDKFVKKGGLVNLLKAPYDAGKYQKDFVEYKWQQGTSPDGMLLAFPWDIGPISLFYQREVFKAAGLPSEPEKVREMLKTWDDFIKVGQQISKPNGPWMFNNANQIMYVTFARHDFFDDNYNVAVDSPKALAALQYGQAARKAGIDAKVDNWTPEWQAMFPQGKLATQLSGGWFGGFLKTRIDPTGAGKWGVVPIPGDPWQNWGGSFLAIPEQSKNKEAAWKFIEYMLADKTAQNNMFKAVDYFPSYKPAWDDPMYHEADPYFGGQKTRELWIEIASKVPKMILTPMDTQADSIVQAESKTAIDQMLDPKAALAKIKTQIEKDTAQDKEMALKMRGKK